MNLGNIKKALNEMGTIIAQNKRVQHLLMDDSYDLSNKVDILNVDQMFEKHFINLTPQVQQGIEEMNRNNLIIFFLQDIQTNERDNNKLVNVSIHVICNVDTSRIYNNRERALEIADLIVQDLDGRKLSSAGKVGVNYISHVTYSEFTTGYRIGLNFTDQENTKAEI